MRWIVGSSLRLSAVVLAAVGVLAFAGIIGLRHASVDTLPEFLPPQVQVQTEALGLSVNEVEQLVTVPLEDEFNGLAFLDHIRSQSVPGLSVIQLTFKPGTDIYKARQLVTERVAQGPAVVNVGTPPVMIEPLSSESRVMMIGLSSKDLAMVDLSTLARWRIRPRLLAVPGVANVTIWGQRDKQLQVLIDPARMSKLGVTLEQVINTAGDAMWTSPLTFVEASSPGADGFIDTPNQRLSVQHVLPIQTPKDLAAVPVEDTTGKAIRLGQVATVVAGPPALRGDAVLKDGSGFLLVVEKFPGANTLAVTKGVEAAMADLKPGLTGVTVDATVFRPATFVETAIHNVGLAALVGIVLLVVWLGLAARSWRIALIGLLAVVLPVVAAAIVLYIRGTTFNTMTIAGLVVALGVIVDDAVVGVLAIRRRLQNEHETGGETSRADLVTEACLNARRPLGYAVAIILLAAIPLLLLTGLGGSFARPLMVSYVLAIVVSTVVALVATPVLGYLLLRPSSRERQPNPVVRWFARGLDRCVTGSVRRSALALAAAGLLIVAGAVVIPLLSTGPLVPAMRDRNLLVQWQAAPGTSLPEMERLTATAGAALRSIRGVRNVASDLGQALLGDQVVDVNSAQTWISLDAKADYDSMLAAVRRTVDAYPGLRHTVLTYAQASLDAARTNTGKAVIVRLYGSDAHVLDAEAQQVRQSISQLHGVVDPQVQSQIDEPAVQIQANVATAARYGLKPGDIRRATAVLIAGIPVGSYYQQQQIFDVTVWSIPSVRQNLTDIRNLMLDTPNGGRVPLRKVATVSMQPAPAEIDHDQVSRYLDITADVRGDLGSTLSLVERKLQTLPLPLGYHAEVSSDVQQERNADTRTLLEALVVAAGIFLLLQAASHSWGRAALLFLTLPLAAVGGLLAALLAGRALTAGALIGFIAVFGIAVRNGILLIGRLQRLEREHAELGGADLVARAAREAAFPVVVTAVALALLFLPFVVRGTVPGLEILRPLSLVVLGGLVTSTLLTLFIVPALYVRLVARAPAINGIPQNQGGTP